MSTFDSTKRSLPDILADITSGKSSSPTSSAAGFGMMSMSKVPSPASPAPSPSEPSFSSKPETTQCPPLVEIISKAMDESIEQDNP